MQDDVEVLEHQSVSAAYASVGGLSPQIEAIRDLLEIPLTRPELFRYFGAPHCVYALPVPLIVFRSEASTRYPTTRAAGNGKDAPSSGNSGVDAIGGARDQWTGAVECVPRGNGGEAAGSFHTGACTGSMHRRA